jgi:hypothetical protein
MTGFAFWPEGEAKGVTDEETFFDLNGMFNMHMRIYGLRRK